LFGSTETDQAKGFMNFWIILTGIIEGLATALNALIAPLSSVFGNTKPMENWLDTMLNGLLGIVGSVTGLSAPLPTPPSTTSGTRPNTNTVNINVNSTNATPTQIVDKVREYERQTGTRMFAR
jgi:hypothetical protein